MGPSEVHLRGKRSLIVGASGGIGAAIARAFASAGADVAVAGRSEERLAALRAQLEVAGARAVTIILDVRHEQSVADGVSAAVLQLGGLDVVVNSSGISPIYKSAERIAAEEWDETFLTNSRGAFLVARAAGRHMMEARGGSIVFVTSMYEQVGGERLAAYAASKGAVSLLARSLALDWARSQICVNCVAPGYVQTDLTSGLRSNPTLRARLEGAIPLARMAEPDEVAGAAVYLSSDAARYVTGSTLVVDGGWSAR